MENYIITKEYLIPGAKIESADDLNISIVKKVEGDKVFLKFDEKASHENAGVEYEEDINSVINNFVKAEILPIYNLIGKEIVIENLENGERFLNKIIDLKINEDDGITTFELEDVPKFLIIKSSDEIEFINNKQIKSNHLDNEYLITLPKIEKEIEKTPFNNAELFKKEYEGYLIGKNIQEENIPGWSKIEKINIHSLENGLENIEIIAKDENDKVKRFMLFATKGDLQRFIDGEFIEGDIDNFYLILQEDKKEEEDNKIYVLKNKNGKYFTYYDTGNQNLVTDWDILPLAKTLSKSEINVDLKEGETIESFSKEEWENIQKDFENKPKEEIKIEEKIESIDKPEYHYYIIDKNKQLNAGFTYKEDAKKELSKLRNHNPGKLFLITTKRELEYDRIDPKDAANWNTNLVDFSIIEEAYYHGLQNKDYSESDIKLFKSQFEKENYWPTKGALLNYLSYCSKNLRNGYSANNLEKINEFEEKTKRVQEELKRISIKQQ